MRIREETHLSCVRWPPPADRFGHFIDRTIEMLRKLQAVHPIFRDDLSLWTDTPMTIPLAQDLSNVRELMLKHAWDRKADPRYFSEIDDRGWPTEQSTSEIGFDVRFGNRIPKVSGNMNIYFHAIPDNTYGSGLMGISFPESGFPELEDHEFVKGLLRLAVEHYDPDVGKVGRLDVRLAVEARSGKSDIDEEIPSWLTYYANARVAEALPPGELVERFGPDGVLLTLQRRPSTPDDREAIDHLVRLRQALKAGGYSMRQSLIRSDRSSADRVGY